MTNKKTYLMLWVDDDGQDRYLFETMKIENKGWSIDWALDIKEATEKLASKPYHAMFLDQMLPFNKVNGPSKIDENKPNPWGGCAVLSWIRKAGLPSGIGANGQYDKLKSSNPPLPENEILPVMVISAYYDEAIYKHMTSTSSIDKNINFLPKPISIDALINFLDSAIETKAIKDYESK